LFNGMLASREPVVFGDGISGYGAAFSEATFPSCGSLGLGLAGLRFAPPEELLPKYLVGPSISTPKKPFRMGANGG
jgi:hypothetical protein